MVVYYSRPVLWSCNESALLIPMQEAVQRADFYLNSRKELKDILPSEYIIDVRPWQKDKLMIQYKYFETWLAVVKDRKEGFAVINCFCAANQLDYRYTSIQYGHGGMIVEYSEDGHEHPRFGPDWETNYVRFLIMQSPLDYNIHTANYSSIDILADNSNDRYATSVIHDHIPSNILPDKYHAAFLAQETKGGDG